MELAPPLVSSPWEKCERFTEVFGKVDSLDLKVDILIPPGLKPGVHPVIICFHGGALIIGARDHYPYATPWIPGYAARTSSIILSPDYRLIPNSSASAILADIESFWTWINGNLVDSVARHFQGQDNNPGKSATHVPDLSRILLAGSSAGGFCAVHLALSHPQDVVGVVMGYPMLDVYSDFYAKGPQDGKTVFKIPIQYFLKGEMLDEKIRAATESGPLTNGELPERDQLCVAVMQYGRILESFADEKKESPLKRVRDGTKLPKRIFIIHGEEDSVVPIEHSKDFAKLVKEKLPDTELRLQIIGNSENSEHGFDAAWPVDERRLKAGLDWVGELLEAKED